MVDERVRFITSALVLYLYSTTPTKRAAIQYPLTHQRSTADHERFIIVVEIIIIDLDLVLLCRRCRGKISPSNHFLQHHYDRS